MRFGKDGRRIVALTAYDFPFARLVDASGVDLILVGDSLGMTVLGYENTVKVTMDDMLRHTAAVARGVRRALVVADMPYLSYHISDEQALANAGRFIQEAGAQAVKLEGGRRMQSRVELLVTSGIPVLGHLGILPQSVLVDGGYHVRGRTEADVTDLLEDAAALVEAGVFAIVLEGITADVAARITESIPVPTIGIGAGLGCDGQVQVIHDILGLMPDFAPRHAKQYADLGALISEAIGHYCEEVRQGQFPDEENTFR